MGALLTRANSRKQTPCKVMPANMVPGLVKWRWGKHSPQTDSSVLSFGASPVCLYPVGFARLIILNLDHSGSSSAKAPAPDNALLLCARVAVCSEADVFLQGSG